MSISASLNTLRGVRDAIRDAIVSKGGSLPVGSPMGSYAQAITSLPSGSGGGDIEIPFRSRLTVPGDTDPWHLTSLTATQVGNSAFYMDTLLTSVSLPLVTSISAYAFQYCSALTSLTLSSTTVATLSHTNALQGTPIASGTGHIYVPDHLVGQYKTATNWNDYANQILPLSQKP